MQIDTLLFDLDGTLLDTREYILQAFEYVLSQHSFIGISRSEITQQIGKPLERCYQNLTHYEDVEELMVLHNEFQMNHIHLSTLYPKAYEVLKHFHNNGFALGLVTNRSKANVESTIHETGIMPFFSCFLAIEDVDQPKPHPEPLIRAMDILGSTSQQTAFVGDSETDVVAGKEANIYTIGITHGFHGESLHEHEPDCLVDSLSELIELDQLIK